MWRSGCAMKPHTVTSGQVSTRVWRRGKPAMTSHHLINFCSSGQIAFGLIPFLKFSTNTNELGNDSIEGGIGIPLQVALPGGFALALETGVNFIRNSNDDGSRPAFINALLLSHTLFTDRLT